MLNIEELLKGMVADDKLAEVVAKVKTAVDAELSKSDTVPKSRFSEVIKERNDATAKLAETEVEIEGLKTKLTEQQEQISQANTYKEKLEKYEQESFSKVKEAWSNKAKFFEVDEKSKDKDRIEKLKSKFSFAKEGEELTKEQISKNNELYDILVDTGAIVVGSGGNGTPPKIPRNEPPGGKGNGQQSLADIITRS